MKPYLFSVLFCFFSLTAFAVGDTLHIYFPPDEAFMTDATRKQLDKIADILKEKDKFWLIGYADDRGDKYYNDMLSMRRAQSVAKYMQEKGIAETDIKLAVGKGEINRWADESKIQHADRRVDIIAKGGKPPVKNTEKEIGEVKVGETLNLKNIQFHSGSESPLPTSKDDLEALFRAMVNNRNLVIQIEGHICCSIEPEGDTTLFGYKLSIGRSKTVYNYLTKKGIKEERLSYKGFSCWKKLRPELTIEDMAANRRVEIRVLKK